MLLPYFMNLHYFILTKLQLYRSEHGARKAFLLIQSVPRVCGCRETT
jgi:hypothetical protein